MAITINWAAKIINIPKADMTLVDAGPPEIRSLDLDTFRKDLNALQESEEGMPFDTTHYYTAPLPVAGITLNRVVEILNGYTIQFENLQYSVNIIGGNSNIGDVKVQNQVSVNTANSAGLQLVTSGSGVTEQDKLDIADRVWDEPLTGHATAGTASIMLQMKNIRKGVALPWFHFLFRNSTSKQPQTGVIGITGQVCQDDGAWTPLTNSCVEIGMGLYRVDGGLTSSEMNADMISFRFTASGVDAALVSLVTTS